ncbi:winged helix DNA-binding domain-containing protein [Actinophytocola sediminis]
MRRLDPNQTRRDRVARQGLNTPAANVHDAVARVVGLQAQDPRANRLAVRARTTGRTAADVDAACRDRTVVRTWAMRGTLHMLTAEDYWWVNGLLGPYFAARGAPRRRQLGLADALLDKAASRIERLSEPLPRRDLIERLDLGIDERGQAPAHLLSWAANVGLVCRGPETARDEPTYVQVRDWLGPRPDTDPADALATLAHRYLAGYGPATAEDLAAWSGLPITRARDGLAAIADLVDTVELDGSAAYVLTGAEPAPACPPRLLGHFDAYLLGYRGRDLAVPAGLRSRIQSGGGFVMPTVLVDGAAVGTWRATPTQGALVVELHTDRKISAEIGNEVTDLGRFLDVRAELVTPSG